MTANRFSEKALKEKAEKWSEQYGKDIWEHREFEKLAYVAGANETLSELKQLLEDKLRDAQKRRETANTSFGKIDWLIENTKVGLCKELLAELNGSSVNASLEKKGLRRR